MTINECLFVPCHCTGEASPLQRNLIKVTLFACSILFSAAAVWAYFALPSAYVVTFGTLSGGASVLFILACLSSLKNKKIAEKKHEESRKDLQDRSALLFDIDKRAEAYRKESQDRSERVKDFLNDNLLKALDENQTGEILKKVGQKLCQILRENENVADAAAQMKPFFDRIKEDDKKLAIFSYLCMFTEYTLPTYEKILNLIGWNFESCKNKICELFSLKIANDFIEQSETTICKGKNLPAVRLILVTKHIFGSGEFFFKKLSDMTAKAILDAIKSYSNSVLINLRKNGREKDNKSTPIGIYLELGQFTECRFPAYFIVPLLPGLMALPGLVGLDMQDIGSKEETEVLKTTFGDEDIDDLLEILRTNPQLLTFKVSVGDMSKDKKAAFLDEVDKTLEERLSNLDKIRFDSNLDEYRTSL